MEYRLFEKLAGQMTFVQVTEVIFRYMFNNLES
jgi:hypothetical protein